MINLAVLFAANQAPFLALVQVIVYTGAVMMLFLFVVMLVGIDTVDSLVETLKGQRIAGLLLVLGFGLMLVLAVGTAVGGVAGQGLAQANEEYGGNVQGLANLMFTTFLLPLEAVAGLLITAALGALVLAHRERWGPKRDQAALSKLRMLRYKETGEHPGPLPSPGVLATSNAIGTPALLPDGSPTDLSIPAPLRGGVHSRLADTREEIEADVAEVAGIASGEEAMRPESLEDVTGHADPAEESADEADRGDGR
jgi:NADH-quinone oxidoreductase subunit J